MTQSRRYRIGAIHALMNAIPTTQTAFDRNWSAADVAHLLDGSLYLDRSRGTADDASSERASTGSCSTARRPAPRPSSSPARSSAR